jgi:uncharacterized membrane protein YbhN (UPF0104 family)
MSKSKPVKKRLPLWRVLLVLALFGVAAYVLAAHWQTVRGSLDVARDASIPWLALSLLLMTVTFCIAAGIYSVLALHRLRYRQTILVEVATAFVNRLLPSGIGGLGLHGVYLYKRKHTAAEATVVVSVNNLIGMVAHLLLLACVLVFYPDILHQFISGGHGTIGWQVGVAVLLVALGAIALPMVRLRIASFARNLLVSLRKLSMRNVAQAILLAAALTTTYTFILFSVARSLHIHLGTLQLFIVFSLGMLTSTATPTPGGLVGAEAGLFAGFVAYGVSSPLAGAAALLYRLVTYWLPLIPGALALLLSRKRKLV